MARKNGVVPGEAAELADARAESARGSLGLAPDRGQQVRLDAGSAARRGAGGAPARLTSGQRGPLRMGLSLTYAVVTP